LKGKFTGILEKAHKKTSYEMQLASFFDTRQRILGRDTLYLSIKIKAGAARGTYYHFTVKFECFVGGFIEHLPSPFSKLANRNLKFMQIEYQLRSCGFNRSTQHIG
jgi:hypothetical protein